MGKKSILLADLLIKPNHSLVKQSLSSRESRTITNGDGFGLGWYTTFDKEPALFTSLFPAWNDRNLKYLAYKTQSPLFFGHVRAANVGGISQYNCHPFIHDHWMFMHNGLIPHFDKIKRKLHALLDDDLYAWIKGSTDSESIFALFLQVSKHSKSNKITDVAAHLEETFSIIQKLSQECRARSPSHFNICLTDGKRLITCRYCSSKHAKQETMYWALDNQTKGQQQIIIASEKFTKPNQEWKLIPTNSFLMVEHDFELSTQKILI
jgi:predicted glutamine amidotransferase